MPKKEEGPSCQLSLFAVAVEARTQRRGFGFVLGPELAGGQLHLVAHFLVGIARWNGVAGVGGQIRFGGRNLLDVD